jgi:hypothetical protein
VGASSIPSGITLFAATGGRWNVIELPEGLVGLPLADQMAAVEARSGASIVLDGDQSETKLKELRERIAKRLKIDPGKIAERERRKLGFVFPARRMGTRDNGHISLSGLENCHNDVLEAFKKKGHSIPCPLRFAPHVRDKRGARSNAPANAGVSLGTPSLRQVQKHVHPTQDHQQDETDRIDKIGQERNASMLSQCILRPKLGPYRLGIRGI